MLKSDNVRYEAIIGFQIGSIITNDITLVRAALKLNMKDDIRLIKKDVADFMGNCDLGQNWDHLAKSKILFYLKNDEPITIEQYDQEIEQKDI